MSIKSRLDRLEAKQPETPAPRISDGDRMAQMKQLAQVIAIEARAHGLTAKNDPRLALPLAIAEVIQ